MRLQEILDVDRIDADFTADSKTAALSALAQLLSEGAAGAGVHASTDDVRRVLEAREALQSTGVGSGVAIPHGRLGGLDRFVGALAIHHGGVEFEAIDGQPVSILFAVIGPERAAGEHLKCLARIGRLLRDDGVRARLQGAKSAEDALSIVREVDG
jgi:PTS system nitrogen regulatory IIA component